MLALNCIRKINKIFGGSAVSAFIEITNKKSKPREPNDASSVNRSLKIDNISQISKNEEFLVPFKNYPMNVLISLVGF